MLVSVKRMLGAVAVTTVFGATAWGQAAAQSPQAQGQQAQGQPAQGQPAQGQQAQGQQAQGPQWKDRAEYDLVQNIQKTTDPAKQVALLDEWKQKYPQTDFAKLRAGMYLQAYQKLNQIPKLIDAANELVAVDPKDVQTLSALLVLAFQLNNTSPEMLAFVEKTAQNLLANIENKPAAVTEEQWKTQKPQTMGLAHRALGWVAMQRKDVPQIKEHLSKSLENNPAQGDVSYWLGQAIISEKDETTYPLGLFHVARAAVYDGPGSLPAPNRQPINDYLVKAYKGYHGDETDLDKLKAVAKANALPPPDFKILSVREVEELKAQQARELAEKDPSLALWKGIKSGLMTEGEAYYERAMKDAEIPNLRGYLVEQTPKTLVLAMTKGGSPEVTLELDSPMRGKAEPGTELTFTAVAKNFSQEPFMLTMDAQKKDIQGWPEPAPRKPAARKSKRR